MKSTAVRSQSGYYPFGMSQPGGSYLAQGAQGYRYGFNGKEQDKEGMGGGGPTYDYGFRIYNPGIAKFLSVDPLTKSYPMLTPYQFASNSPIDGIDLDGQERIHYTLSYEFTNKVGGEVTPVFNFVGVQKTRDVQVTTILSAGNIFGLDLNPVVKFPLEKEIVIHTTTENGAPIGYRFKNMQDATVAARNGFTGVDRQDPTRTVQGEDMWLNDFNRNAQALGPVAGVMANVVSSRVLSNPGRSVINAKKIETPYGDALQGASPKALEVASEISENTKLYRIGTTGRSQAGEAQFWALENPLENPAGFAKKYGIPVENVQNANFIEIGRLKKGQSFITREAPPTPTSGPGSGGGVEVVTNSGGVTLDSFHTLNPSK